MTRKAIISALDDDYGVSKETYEKIRKVCVTRKWDDILKRVRATEGRYYLPSDHGLR